MYFSPSEKAAIESTKLSGDPEHLLAALRDKIALAAQLAAVPELQPRRGSNPRKTYDTERIFG